MISLHYTSHTKAYNTIYAACNIVEAIYFFTQSGIISKRLKLRSWCDVMMRNLVSPFS